MVQFRTNRRSRRKGALENAADERGVPLARTCAEIESATAEGRPLTRRLNGTIVLENAIPHGAVVRIEFPSLTDSKQ